jgi:hypothetical protein
MIELHLTEPGNWVCFITDPNTREIIKIKVGSREQDGKPSPAPTDELFAEACNTAKNACAIRDRMGKAILDWISEPWYPSESSGIICSLKCNQDLLEFFAQTGLTPLQMTDEQFLSSDMSNFLRLMEKPKLVFLELGQTKGFSKYTNKDSEIFTTGWFVDPWTHLWSVGDGYIDGPYSLHFPSNYQAQT